MSDSQRFPVAAHTLAYLAHKGAFSREKAVSSSVLAASVPTNPVVIRRVMAGLREEGYVRSEKGHGGGWVLACDLAKVTLRDVYDAVGRPSLLATVFPPPPGEYGLLREGQVVFGFWALAAARPEDVALLSARRITAIGFEAIADAAGHAPVLTSMSELAGALAVTVGASLLLSPYGGNGVVFGGAIGVPPASFVVLGAGVLGRAAARAALGAGAAVVLLDRSLECLRTAVQSLPHPVPTLLATRPNIENALSFADIVLGAAAVRGERAPVLVTREMLRRMKPRALVMDLSIDMGGCFETSRPTAFPEPEYEVDGIRHFCVPNLPAVAARSATLALTNAALPYVAEVAAAGCERALEKEPDLRRGTYLLGGTCVHDGLARALGQEGGAR